MHRLWLILGKHKPGVEPTLDEIQQAMSENEVVD
jgi:hypothetical protein